MDKIKIGLIGYGYIGKVHTMGYLNMPVSLPGFNNDIEMSTLIRRKDSPIEKSSWIKTGYDASDLIDEKVHFVDVCTPNFAHLEQVTKLIENGINIYCEKPLGLNFEESSKLSELAEQKGIINQTALVYRFMPSLAKVRSFILNGGIGKIVNFKAQLLHSSYLNPQRPITWRLIKEQSGGGALVDLGIHLIDMVRFVLGEVSSLRAETNTEFKSRPGKGKEVPVDVDDQAFLELKMAGGARGTIEVSKISLNPLEAFSFEIYGLNGFIKISDIHHDVPVVYRYNSIDGSVDNITLKAEDDYSRYLSGIYPPSRMSSGRMIDLHMASQANMINNVAKGKVIFSETPTFLEGTKSQNIIDNAYRSAEEGSKEIAL